MVNSQVLILGLSLAAVMLVYTSYLDLKKREVEDKVWLIFGGMGIALQAYEIASGARASGISSLVALALALLLATTIGMGLFYFGFYGGADGKALIVIALLVPSFSPNVGFYSIAPLIVLTNGVLASIALPVGLLFYNLSRLARGEDIFSGFQESIPRKALACLLGFRQSGMPRPFQFSMEKEKSKTEDQDKTSGTSIRKFDFSLMRDDFETKGGTWVTPGIPLLVFFAIGYFVMLFYGDMVIGLIQFIFHTFSI